MEKYEIWRINWKNTPEHLSTVGVEFITFIDTLKYIIISYGLFHMLLQYNSYL